MSMRWSNDLAARASIAQLPSSTQLDLERGKAETDLQDAMPRLDPAQVDLGRLRVENDTVYSGTKPILFFRGADGRRYVFKAAPKALVAAEVLAHELRTLGKRPSLGVMAVDQNVGRLGHLSGMLKPVIPFDGRQILRADTASWSPLQREVMLREHPWEWLLENLDTHAGQYALVGEHQYPFNFDWDRSFFHEGHRRLSRYARHRPLLPSVRNFLYEDYVKGRVELDFGSLLEEAEKVQALPDAQLRALFSDYARARYEAPRDRTAFVARALTRKRRMVQDFTALVKALEAERERRTGRRTPSSSSGLDLLVAKWQDALLHRGYTIQRSPLTRHARAARRAFEAKRGGVPGEAPRSEIARGAAHDLHHLGIGGGAADLRLLLRDAVRYDFGLSGERTFRVEVPGSREGALLHAHFELGESEGGLPKIEKVVLEVTSDVDGDDGKKRPLDAALLPQIKTPTLLEPTGSRWSDLLTDQVTSLALRRIEIAADGAVTLEGEARMFGGLMVRPVRSVAGPGERLPVFVELEQIARGMLDRKPDQLLRGIAKAVARCAWELELYDRAERKTVEVSSRGAASFEGAYGVDARGVASIRTPSQALSVGLEAANDAAGETGRARAWAEMTEGKKKSFERVTDELRWDAFGARFSGLDFDRLAPVSLSPWTGSGRAPKLGSPAFMKRLDQILGPAAPLHLGNQVDFIENGDALHRARLELIGRAGAGQALLMQTFIFHDDPAGRDVVDALIAAKKRGAEVRVLIDAGGSLDSPVRDVLRGSAVVRRLRRHGVPVALAADPRKPLVKMLQKVHRLAKTDPQLGEQLKAAGAAMLGWLWELVRHRDHLKALAGAPLEALLSRGPVLQALAQELEIAKKVAPARVHQAFSELLAEGNGDDVGRALLRLIGRDHRKRMMLYGEGQSGPVAELLMGGNNVGDEYERDPLTADAGPKPHQTGFVWRDADLRIRGAGIVAQDAREFARSWREAGGREDVPLWNLPEATAAPQPGLPLRLVHSRPQVVGGDKSAENDRFSNFLLATLEGAEKGDRVRIETPYFVPLPQIHRAMVDAARRGARISIVTNGPHEPNDGVIAAEHARWFHLRDLLREGVEVFERLPDADPLHQKSVLALDRKSRTLYAVGSANVDQLSARLNREMFVVGGTVFGPAQVPETIEAGLIRSFRKHTQAEEARQLSFEDLQVPSMAGIAELYARAVIAPLF
ncbi:MAG: phosphatidylserine/phosphatidylglycerophosphate/cardiolipin synthase family protein [Deltaproteobacteria bacterium]|nr:phosphatidylserine/phosphatidylglycerophosphate/cardiolipin synthase family protein [Deltaproteobacteria bacterium]